MRRLILLFVLLVVLPAAAAHAAPQAGIVDDRLLFGDDGAATARDWAAAGADSVRIHARWEEIAPSASAKLPPRGFRSNDPDDPAYRWSRLDAAVGRARDAGLQVLLAVTGPGPLWASARPSRGSRRYAPDPRYFGAFAHAAAARYGERVATWLIWNEPNQPLWLQPQRVCTKSGCRPFAPHEYRLLARAADRGIRSALPKATVVAGTLAPTGGAADVRSVNATMSPLAFLRAMACVDTKLRAVHGGSCRGFSPVRTDGFAIHPYGVTAGPTAHAAGDGIRLADVAKLERVLDTLVARGRLRGPRHMPLYLTEYGWQTRPPDRFLGVSLSRQSAWLSESAARAARDRRIANLSWYVWRDEPLGAKRTSGWQGGFFFADGREKPALRAFRFPFDVRGGRVWGQVRPGGAHTVTIVSGGADVATLATGENGAFAARLAIRRGATAYARSEDGLVSPVVRAG